LIGILFVCHGNICRSPMAEFVFKEMLKQRGLESKFFIASAATSSEEIGNPVHFGTKKKLKEHGISAEGKCAVQLTKKDYEVYDYLIAMDGRNMTNMIRLFGSDHQKKISRLLEFAGEPRDISDPWYTGNFDETYDDVVKGCKALLEHILDKNHDFTASSRFAT